MRLVKSLAFALVTSAAVMTAPLAEAADFVLKAAHNADTSEPGHVSTVEFGRLIKEATKGRVEVQVFPNGQLGSERELMEGLLLGNVDVIKPASPVVGNFVPEMNVLNMPFLFRDEAHLEKVMVGPFYEKLSQLMAAKGFRLIGMHTTGTRHIMSKKPIFSIEDLKGLKIRTQENPAQVFAFNTFGANATPIAYTELYGALQTGVVDGAEAANTNYHAKKFYEVAPYWALVGWMTLANPFMMSEKKFKSFPADIQAALLDAGKKSGEHNRALYTRSDNEKLAELLAAGVKVTMINPVPFRTASKKVYERFLKTDADRELVRLIEETK